MPKPLQPGDEAPPFRTEDHTGTVRSLDDYAGQGLVLYFFPYDGSQNSLVELRDFRDHQKAFDEAGIALLGVSTDNPERRRDLAKQEDLSFPLLVDDDHQMARAYHTYQSWFTVAVDKRITYLVDGDGVVRETWTVTHPPREHAEIVLDRARELGIARSDPS